MSRWPNTCVVEVSQTGGYASFWRQRADATSRTHLAWFLGDPGYITDLPKEKRNTYTVHACGSHQSNTTSTKSRKMMQDTSRAASARTPLPLCRGFFLAVLISKLSRRPALSFRYQQYATHGPSQKGRTSFHSKSKLATGQERKRIMRSRKWFICLCAAAAGPQLHGVVRHCFTLLLWLQRSTASEGSVHCKRRLRSPVPKDNSLLRIGTKK
jgi:hypothetical protein